MSSDSTSWRSQTGYIWSMIGSAVGFANILSFSAQAFKNGGGAFLIPYFAALLILGIPMLLLEGIIGHQTKLPAVAAYGKAWGRIGKTFGWTAALACLTIGGFYIVLTGYAVAYTYFSAFSQIPEDTKGFFLNHFLQVTDSIENFGKLSIPIFLSTIAVAGISWFVLVRNVRDGIEKVCTIFMPLLAVMMAAFAIVVCFLPGGSDGLYYYLKPDFSKLSDPALWRDIFGQLFFSLSLGLGIIIGYSRHTGKKTNIARAMLWVALGDFAVSFVAGLAIFGCIAHFSHVQGVPFDAILTTDSTFEIGFILFPKILQLFGPTLSPILGSLFFFCVFIAGLTGLFSIVESIAGNAEVEFKISRQKAVTITIAAITGVACFFCMGNSTHIIDALAPMVLGINMLIGGLVLIIAFLYASKEIQNHAVWEINRVTRFYKFSLRYIAPLLLGVILIGNLWNEAGGLDAGKTVRWAWFAAVLLLSGFLARPRKTAEIQLNLACHSSSNRAL